MSIEVLSVIQNWRRPENVRQVVLAVRRQSVDSHLAIVDCAAGTEWAVPPDVAAMADVVFSIGPQNLGPCCRFLPSLTMPHFSLTMFWLDDHLPGDRCLEAFLRHRDMLDYYEVATLGQDGRVFAEDLSIIRRRVKCYAGAIEPVDVVVSSELCRTHHVVEAVQFRQEMLVQDDDSVLSADEDDLWLCLGIRRKIRRQSAIFCPFDDQESYRLTRLPAPHALSARPDHDARRTELVRHVMKWVRA